MILGSWSFFLTLAASGRCFLRLLECGHSEEPSRAETAAAKSLQSCPTLCDPIDGSPPGFPVPGILQARTLSGLPFPSPMQESEK